MRLTVIMLVAVAIIAGIGISLLWQKSHKDHLPAATQPTTQSGEVFHIGLVPEQDVFEMKKAYRGLAAYLSARLGRPVEVVMLSTYEGVLHDFRENEVDAAFLGSLVAVLTMDRLDARPLVKPERPDGKSSYRGMIFVREDSPIQSIEQMGGHSIGMVRTTLAGALFPIAEMLGRPALQGEGAPRIVWMGTHDDVIDAVLRGRVDVGAAKDLRLDTMEAAHAKWKFRRLAGSPPVPNNVLIVRRDVAEKMGDRLERIFTGMHNDADGRAALAALGIARFARCGGEEYKAIYDLVERLGDAWPQVGVGGAAPRRRGPETRPQ